MFQDVWSLGVVLFDCLQTLEIGFLEEEEEKQRVNFRELSFEGRKAIIEEHIKDKAIQNIIVKMLSDIGQRPTASDLLKKEITVQLYSYILEEDTGISIEELSSKVEALPAFISGLTLSNKNNGVISMLSIMNLYQS